MMRSVVRNRVGCAVHQLAGFIACLTAAIVFFGGPGSAQVVTPDAAEPTTGTSRVVVRFITTSDFPPFNFYDEEGVLTGFNVDLARALCLEIGATCDIKARPWQELLPAIRRGEADAAIAAHSVTGHALAKVDFTDRYLHTPARFAVRRDAPSFDATPEGLVDRRIGVAGKTAHAAYLKGFFGSSRIVIFPNPELARDALLAGRVDAIFDDGISLSFWLNGTLSRQCCKLRGGAFLEPRYFGDGLAIAVPKSDPQVKTLINDALKEVRASGRFGELVSRYFPYALY